MKDVKIYTDGSCSPNPGTGGYGVILEYNGVRKEIYGGYQNTTNNRMEMMAAIVGLESLIEKCNVTVTSDSALLVNTVNCGWKTKKNKDLWQRLFKAIEKHNVKFEWIKGHNSHPENERCDYLASKAKWMKDLPVDTAS
jgi:ribonuclease HI